MFLKIIFFFVEFLGMIELSIARDSEIRYSNNAAELICKK